MRYKHKFDCIYFGTMAVKENVNNSWNCVFINVVFIAGLKCCIKSYSFQNIYMGCYINTILGSPIIMP